MDPFQGLEINATTTCTVEGSSTCDQYVTSIPASVVGDIVFTLGILVFFATFIFLGYFFGTFSKNPR